MIDGITIVQGDFLSSVASVPDESVDCVFADFPFNCQDGRRDYPQFVRECAAEMIRIAKPGAAICALNNPHGHFKSAGAWVSLILVNEVTLVRPHAFRPARHFGFQHNTLLVMSKGKLKTWHGVQKNHEAGPTDVLDYQNGFRGFGDWHPQAIGYNLTRTFVELLTNPGDLVVDPFVGSGTTPKACVDSGRLFWGTEFKPHFYQMARRRVYGNGQIEMTLAARREIFSGACPACGDQTPYITEDSNARATEWACDVCGDAWVVDTDTQEAA